MNNEELREMCAKIAEKELEYRVIGFGSVQCRIAKSIRAIQLPVEQNNTDEEEPQRTPEQWAEHSAALHRIKNALPVEQSRKDFATSDGEGGFKDLISQFRKAAWERDIDEMLRIQKFIFDLVENELPEQEPIGVLIKARDGFSSVSLTSDKWHQQNLLRLWNSEKLRHTAKLIYEAPPSLKEQLQTQVHLLELKNEKLQGKSLSAEKWKGVASAKFGDGRTVQQIEIEATEPLLKQVAELKESLRYLIGHANWWKDMATGCEIESEEMDIAMERAK